MRQSVFPSLYSAAVTVMYFVARIRRRGDRPPPSSSGVVCLSILKNMVRQGIFCLLAVKDGMRVAT
jgi:hypothetical protein